MGFIGRLVKNELLSLAAIFLALTPLMNHGGAGNYDSRPSIASYGPAQGFEGLIFNICA
jgi:hypothetical protein